MSFVTALCLFLQFGYSDAQTTQPTTQRAGGETRFSIHHAQPIPPVYPENYATRYLGLPAQPAPRVSYVPPPMCFPPPPPPPPYAPYRREMGYLVAPAPFVRGNYYNPSPFVRSFNPPVRHGGNRGAAHRR
jgi:hypothetical protein